MSLLRYKPTTFMAKEQVHEQHTFRKCYVVCACTFVCLCGVCVCVFGLCVCVCACVHPRIRGCIDVCTYRRGPLGAIEDSNTVVKGPTSWNFLIGFIGFGVIFMPRIPHFRRA